MANEKRLIDANALMDALRTNEGAKALGHSVHRLFCVDDIIEKQPTVDAVEVVRCKDCKHNVANKEYDPLDATDYTDIVCDYWMNDGNLPNDFCSYGERRTDV